MRGTPLFSASAYSFRSGARGLRLLNFRERGSPSFITGEEWLAAREP